MVDAIPLSLPRLLRLRCPAFFKAFDIEFNLVLVYDKTASYRAPTEDTNLSCGFIAFYSVGKEYRRLFK